MTHDCSVTPSIATTAIYTKSLLERRTPALAASSACSTGEMHPPSEAVRAVLEVADIFRRFAARLPGGPWRVMPPSAQRPVERIEHCRTAALGGHVRPARTAATDGSSPITAAATGTAQVHRALPRAVARRARGRHAAGRILPRRLHRARPRSPTSLVHNKAVVYDLLMQAAPRRSLESPRPTLPRRHALASLAVLHTWGLGS